MGQRLIEAQERERARIARELHDDTIQRLALLAIGIKQIGNDLSQASDEILRRLDGLWKITSEISTDLQALSHELHSAKLQYLGLVPAMRSFCEEFESKQDVTVQFESHDVTRSVSPDISLCLFRVLQESLRNAWKHSGVRQFKVRLQQTAGMAHLIISDSGAGFDPIGARRSHGLGLISMKERLHLVKGEISIESQAYRGTTIHARVPLSPLSDPIHAAR
jgi:signal transduction histidine kinase